MGMTGMGPVQVTMRPGTMNRGGGGMPPPTGGRVPTAQRMGTRQGTAAQAQPGIGALTEVKISERPITNMGVSGMKTGSFGPKRQIYDQTYYMLELRKKCKELGEEVTKLNK